jgi:hypothetical protein
MASGDALRPSPAEVARDIAGALESRGYEHALGGAIALGYWGAPRGTIDVDVTIYVPPDDPGACVDLLRAIGCQVERGAALATLREHGFCRVNYRGVPVDVFLPTIAFYEEARQRRRTVRLGDRMVAVWDAETLAVFKMMFFRRRDVADVEQILRVQGDGFDSDWVERQLEGMYGRRDPRLSQWRELVNETRGKP